MRKILVVEDSSTVTQALRRIIELESDFLGVYSASYKETTQKIAEHREDIFVALVDLNLPDAADGEVVDYLLSLGVPTIVLTANFDEGNRENLFRKGIVDYVSKEGLYSFRYAVKLVDRIYKNQKIKVLVVDDSEVSRRFVGGLLKLYLFEVYTANDGVEATKMLLDMPDIKMLITDYNMPNMDGFALVQSLRNRHKKTDLVIIGISSEGQESLSAKFIKNGANDFLRKPFNREEFQCRVMHNIQALEHIEQIRNIANRDYLTGAYNRRYFFNSGGAMYKTARQDASPLAVAVIDIDFFKKINDSYGHDVGDGVLKYFSKMLNTSLSRFLVARAGGEEFFILMLGLNNRQACTLIDAAREIICNSVIDIEGTEIRMSFSAGVSNDLCANLDEQIKMADEFLYRAKADGRNCVVGTGFTVINSQPMPRQGLPSLELG